MRTSGLGNSLLSGTRISITTRIRSSTTSHAGVAEGSPVAASGHHGGLLRSRQPCDCDWDRVTLATGVDRSRPEGAAAAKTLWKRHRPRHLWIATPCGPFSIMLAGWGGRRVPGGVGPGTWFFMHSFAGGSGFGCAFGCRCGCGLVARGDKLPCSGARHGSIP